MYLFILVELDHMHFLRTFFFSLQQKWESGLATKFESTLYCTVPLQPYIMHTFKHRVFFFCFFFPHYLVFGMFDTVNKCYYDTGIKFALPKSHSGT